MYRAIRSFLDQSVQLWPFLGRLRSPAVALTAGPGIRFPQVTCKVVRVLCWDDFLLEICGMSITVLTNLRLC